MNSTSTARLPDPSLEWAFSVHVQLGALEDHGQTRVGHRRVVPILGGTITGKISAGILAGGADWQVVRPDGSIEIDGRYSALTDHDELLYLHTVGIRTGPPHVLESLLRGEPVTPSDYYFRTTVEIETSSERLAMYQCRLFVAVAERTGDAVRYTTWELK